MKKSRIVILSIIGVIIIAGIIAYTSIASDKIEPAFLTVESGQVQVDSGTGYKTVTGEVILSLNDKVKTLDGTATIILYETIISELEPNTEVSIKSLTESNVALKQESGSTWNKFTAITGIGSYEIETPTTVATVRGTSFGVNVEEDVVLVGEGKVNVKKQGQIHSLAQFEKLTKLGKTRLTAADKQKILGKAKKNVERIKTLRERMIEKQGPLIKKAMAKYGVSETELKSYLARIDSGELDSGELLAKSPVKTPAMYRFKRMNDALKNQQRLIKAIEAYQP